MMHLINFQLCRRCSVRGIVIILSLLHLSLPLNIFSLVALKERSRKIRNVLNKIISWFFSALLDKLNSWETKWPNEYSPGFYVKMKMCDFPLPAIIVASKVLGSGARGFTLKSLLKVPRNPLWSRLFSSFFIIVQIFLNIKYRTGILTQNTWGTIASMCSLLIYPSMQE